MKPEDCKNYDPLPDTSTCGGCWNEKYDMSGRDPESSPGVWCENFQPIKSNQEGIKSFITDRVRKSHALIASNARWGRSMDYRDGYLNALEWVLAWLSSEERKE